MLGKMEMGIDEAIISFTKGMETLHHSEFIRNPSNLNHTLIRMLSKDWGMDSEYVNLHGGKCNVIVVVSDVSPSHKPQAKILTTNPNFVRYNGEDCIPPVIEGNMRVFQAARASSASTSIGGAEAIQILGLSLIDGTHSCADPKQDPADILHNLYKAD
jgi:hypothetical protein